MHKARLAKNLRCEWFSILKHQFLRRFSKDLTKPHSRLLEHITSELKEEKTAIEGRDMDFGLQYLKTNNWRCTKANTSSKITLSKSIDSVDITILYKAKAPVEDSNAVESENFGIRPKDERSTARFVAIIDKGAPNKLVVDVVTDNGELGIKALFYTKDVDRYLFEEDLVFGYDVYTGPPFESLDERLKDRITNYLDSLGINKDLGVYVEMTSAEHEEKLYLSWLHETRDFIASIK